MLNQLIDTGWINTAPGSGYRYISGSFTIPSTSVTTPIDIQENDMNTTTTTETFERTQRDFLSRQARDSLNRHDMDLERHFGLRDDEEPESVEAAIERVKAGKYVLKDRKDRCSFGHWVHDLRWRDPSKDKDHTGYKAAYNKCKEAYNHTLQDIMVDPLDKAKKSLREFEGWKH